MLEFIAMTVVACLFITRALRGRRLSVYVGVVPTGNGANASGRGFRLELDIAVQRLNNNK